MEIRSCARRGARGGARKGRGAAGGRDCPAKGLMGRVMVRPSTAPWYEAPCPGSYVPPKMDSHWGTHSNWRLERGSFTHPLFYTQPGNRKVVRERQVGGIAAVEDNGPPCRPSLAMGCGTQPSTAR